MNVVRRIAALLVAGVVGTVAPATACSSSGATTRPFSNAQLEILQPTPDEITGPDVHLEFRVVGATVVPSTNGPLRGDQGHIHVYIDGQLVSMYFGTTQDHPNTPPGRHALRAEFVATDHRPFARRIVNSVLFQVRGT
jgi:hypothetical protein